MNVNLHNKQSGFKCTKCAIGIEPNQEGVVYSFGTDATHLKCL